MEYILPEDQRLSFSEKWTIQNNVLLSVYDETYPVSDKDKAIRQIQDWVQKILFWWSDFDSIKENNCWTIALVYDDSRWTTCYEMCRAWSTEETWWWIMAVRKLFNYYLNSSVNQLYATPRNCLERKNNNSEIIPSGKTISKIYWRLENMNYWWISPWYIMPWNVIELLDLRIHTKHDNVKSLLNFWKKIYILDDSYVYIFNQIIKNNYWLENTILSEWISNDVKLTDLKFDILYDENKNIRKYTYSLMKECNDWKYNIFDIEDSILPNIWCWVNLVKLDLFKESNLIVQNFLKYNWYKMVSLFPERDKMMWYWFKSLNNNFALPYYCMENNDFNKNILLQIQLVEKVIMKK